MSSYYCAVQFKAAKKIVICACLDEKSTRIGQIVSNFYGGLPALWLTDKQVDMLVHHGYNVDVSEVTRVPKCTLKRGMV